MKFKELHQQNKPLLIGNVWDARSAKEAEKLSFKALGTSSSAMASMLGYSDGEEITYQEIEFLIKRIVQNTHLPLSVDLESGYSRKPEEIADHIIRLTDLGVVGFNLEDSVVNGERDMLNGKVFSNILEETKNILDQSNRNPFLNIRTDAFLIGNPNALDESVERIHDYEMAGADGIFIPGVEKESDISALVNSTKLPINVMCMPSLPNFEILTGLGVKRISMGNFLFDHMYKSFSESLQEIIDLQSFKSIF
ncbi:isocitrate lyase/phosphoenolpyruvate mutase family protein [Algoriphagus sp. D3-2-R+10]|uniref:isocitrate lyase/PEP mutase family protein n=1 Tax=Algoriphagus aurantiacus TaxID=3103948 RepID=UPI002B3E57AC|nr:isocitrate lyase/phosphoenolpyruvate mutase family protein [Algoriphagus sp. D3-2-R+10]MEB2774379.1 isocitrate lyase/phosphoenolpyruvate mutase family protein [Algoriphagus sp. D3-2-R+10]